MDANPQIAIWTLGQSVEGRPLEVTAIAPTGQTAPNAARKASWPWVLYLAGVHGDETEGVWVLEALRARWAKSFPSPKIGALLWTHANPDGFARGQRWNAHQVDLNRNLATKDWTPEVKNPRYPPGPAPLSEPETAALAGLIAGCEPAAILSAHSFSHFQININGPSREWGERLARVCGYPITEDIGYPTPGCLGSYSGRERQIPTITLEIERGLPQAKVLEIHLPVLEESLRFWTEHFSRETTKNGG